MTGSEQRWAEILARLEAGTLSSAQAAELLGVSDRQVRRLRQSYRHQGLAAVVHGNRGRTPTNRTDPAIVERLHDWVGEGGKYHGLNVCHLQELFATREAVTLGRSTLDRLLKQEGLRASKRDRPKVKRRRRERASAEGMLVQIDGSPHDWLEGRGPKMTLLGGIDDATGKILALHFQPTEDQDGYFRLLRTITQEYGLPFAYYHDRHTILRSPKEPTLDEELAGKLPMSQVQRVLADLGVESIAARSPQAKGRIERLWGTLQDRLIAELRLAQINAQEEANAFLPGFRTRYNARFAQDPTDPATVWVPLPDRCDLAYYFAVRESRQVRSDHCLAWRGQVFQLIVGPGEANLAGKRVQVHRVPEGDLFVYDGTRRLRYHVVSHHSSEQVPKPARSPTRPGRPPDPRAKARQNAWLFGDQTTRQTLD